MKKKTSVIHSNFQSKGNKLSNIKVWSQKQFFGAGAQTKILYRSKIQMNTALSETNFNYFVFPLRKDLTISTNSNC